MKRLLAAIAGLTIALIGTGADAAWLSTGSATAIATATDVERANPPTVTRGAGSVGLSWTASTLASDAPVGAYRVYRHHGSDEPVEVCVATATTCTDVAPLATAVSYGVVATIGTNWRGPESELTPFTYDDAAPSTTASVSPPPNAAGWNQASVTVTLTSTDSGTPSAGVDRITYAIDDGSPVTVDASATSFLVSGTGSHTIAFHGVDAVGNVEVEKDQLVRIDPDAPDTSVTIDPAPNAQGWNNTDVDLSFTATDNGPSGVEKIVIDGVDTVGASASRTVADEGTTTVHYSAVDVAGNVSDEDAVTIRIDRGVPTSSIATTTSSTWTISASDAAPSSGVSIESWVDNGTHTSVTGSSAAVTVPDGNHTIHWFAKDAAGNAEAQHDLPVTVAAADTTGPTLTNLDPADGFDAINNNTSSVNAWVNKACATGKLCLTVADPSGVDASSIRFSLRGTSGANEGKCWNGSTFVTGTTCAITMSFASSTGRATSVNIPQAAMLDGSYQITYWAKDVPGNETAMTISMSIN